MNKHRGTRSADRPRRAVNAAAIDARRALHELEVHKIELEAQNAQLRAAHLAVEALLARYTQLFEFAPLGYAVLSPGDTVREINLTAVQLLGRERGWLIGARFAAMIAPADQATFAAMLARAAKAECGRVTCEVETVHEGADRATLRFTATPLGDDGVTVLLAFEDAGARRRDDLGRVARVTAEAAPRALEAAPRRPRRVLVIEDNQDAAQSLRDALELSGHKVELAFDGPSGLDRARAFRPEVVICDIGLPRMDGYDVARALRADQRLRDAYLVALTGYDGPEELRRTVEAGFDRHVTKPPMIDELDQLLP